MRAVAGEKTAFAYSDDISEAALLDAARTVRTIAAAGQSRARQGRRRARASPASRVLYAPIDPIATLDSTQKVALLEKVEQLARAQGSAHRRRSWRASPANTTWCWSRAPTARIAADVRPLVRLSVQVIAEQTTAGGARVGNGGGGGRFGFGYFTDDVIEQLRRARRSTRR